LSYGTASVSTLLKYRKIVDTKSQTAIVKAVEYIFPYAVQYTQTFFNAILPILHTKYYKQYIAKTLREKISEYNPLEGYPNNNHIS
jgi:hypothetical protein